MKKIILLTVLLFATVQFSVAQNTIAKLKFEDAEELFTNGNYLPTLTKLDEVEKLLNSTNPKILHLKILSQSKIIEGIPKLFYQAQSFKIAQLFAITEDIRKNSDKYLKEYENLPDNEDKYRDIYKISEKIKSYPNTEDAFIAWARPLMQEEYARVIQLVLRVAKSKNDNLNFIFEITHGRYDYIIINGKQYSFGDLYPKEGGECALKVQNDGSILLNGKVLIAANNEENAYCMMVYIEGLFYLQYY